MTHAVPSTATKSMRLSSELHLSLPPNRIAQRAYRILRCGATILYIRNKCEKIPCEF